MGASAAISINDASASARVRCDSTSPLFRRPAELADGLARKEPAPSVDHHGISPNNLGPPLSGTTRRFGVMCPSAACGSALNALLNPQLPGKFRLKSAALSSHTDLNPASYAAESGRCATL